MTSDSSKPVSAEQASDRCGLVTAQLQQQPPTRTQPTRTSPHDLRQQVRSVGTAVQREPWLEHPDVAREQADRVRRHVRHHGRQHVDAVLDLRRERVVEIPLEHLDAVPAGTSRRDRVELGREHGGARHHRGQHGRDRSRPRAEIHGHTPRGEERRRSAREWLGLGSRHVYAGCDGESDAAERDLARQPGDRLTDGAPSHQVLEHIRVAPGGPRSARRLQRPGRRTRPPRAAASPRCDPVAALGLPSVSVVGTQRTDHRRSDAIHRVPAIR